MVWFLEGEVVYLDVFKAEGSDFVSRRVLPVVHTNQWLVIFSIYKALEVCSQTDHNCGEAVGSAT